MDLDREIAERVMGWELGGFQSPFTIQRVKIPFWWEMASTADYPDPHPEPVIPVMRWYPSKDITQAFQVVEKMRNGRYWLSLRWAPALNPKWVAYFEFSGMAPASTLHGRQEADTPAEAICRATLAVMST